MVQTLDPPQTTPQTPRAACGALCGFEAYLLIKPLLLASLVILLAEGLRIFAGNNLHTVTAGRCYRSAQPTAALIEEMHRVHGIRSIINLRGDNPGEPWFEAEDTARKRLGIALYDAGMCSGEQVPEDDFRRFATAVKNAQEPILIHCANGNDRTGLGSAAYLLLRTDTSIADARRQLSLRYGHFSMGSAMCLHRVLDNYESWLRQTGQSHSPDRFYHWGMHEYRKEVLR